MDDLINDAKVCSVDNQLRSLLFPLQKRTLSLCCIQECLSTIFCYSWRGICSPNVDQKETKTALDLFLCPCSNANSKQRRCRQLQQNLLGTKIKHKCWYYVASSSNQIACSSLGARNNNIGSNSTHSNRVNFTKCREII